MTRFEQETGDYRGGDTFVYNASWRFLEPQDTGTFYIASTPSGEVFANRYQVLDQVLATRGLLKDTGLRLDTQKRRDPHHPHRRHPKPQTSALQPRNPAWLTSDHLPVTAILQY